MKKLINKFCLPCLFLVVLFGFASLTLFAQPPDSTPRKIIVFREGFVNETARNALLKNFDAVIIKPLNLINGMAVYLPPQAEKALSQRAEVLRIDDDLVINATGKPADKPGKPQPPAPAEELTWGVDRIEADLTWNRTRGRAIKVAILDTGIDLDHPDLKANIKGNVNLINTRKNGDDDNGHGTHVAGIVAAMDNEIGVIGVGPEIYLYAVKVLDRSGSGWLSDLIEGLDWCINNKMQIVNMSLGASADNQSFHDAIARVYRAGISQVAAAGNNGEIGGAIDYPAKYPETIAVSAIGQYQNGYLYFAPFSSSGPEVDLSAPGVSIKSTYNDGDYRTFDGTSMATPHVSGVAALTLSVKGSMTPDDLKTLLKSKAENIGLNNYEQGAGLIRPDLAIQ